MRALVCTHGPAFPPGLLLNELRSAGVAVASVDLPGGDMPPRDLTGVDLLVLCGGDGSATDTDEHPWLRIEQRFAADALERGVPVIGVGLGAQVLALAAGGTVGPLMWQGQHWREAGWGDVTFTPHASVSTGATAGGGSAGGAALFRSFPPRLEVLHWHDSAITALPAGATVHARSTVCEVQAFTLGDLALGVQFHLEATAEGVQHLALLHRDKLAASGMSEVHLTMDLLRRVQRNEMFASMLFGRFIDRFVDRVSADPHATRVV